MKQLEKSSPPHRGEETIDTCTMDPCPMKMIPKDDQPAKCPDCGKKEKSLMTLRDTLSPGKEEL